MRFANLRQKLEHRTRITKAAIIRNHKFQAYHIDFKYSYTRHSLQEHNRTLYVSYLSTMPRSERSLNFSPGLCSQNS